MGSQVRPQVVTTGDDALSAFEQLAADEPAVANQVLNSTAARSAASRIRVTCTVLLIRRVGRPC